MKQQIIILLFIACNIGYAFSPYTRYNNPNEANLSDNCPAIANHLCMNDGRLQLLNCATIKAEKLCKRYRDDYSNEIHYRWIRGQYINNLTGQHDPNQQHLPKHLRGVKGSHCSAFAHKVIRDFGYMVPPFGSKSPTDYLYLANRQALHLNKSDSWAKLSGMFEAQLYANKGRLVIASVNDTSRGKLSSGHIAIVWPNIYKSLENFYTTGPLLISTGFHSYVRKYIVSTFYVHLRAMQAKSNKSLIERVDRNVQFYTPTHCPLLLQKSKNHVCNIILE